MENKVKFFSKGNLILLAVAVLTPLLIGGILSAALKDLIYLEVIYVVCGLIVLCGITVRLRIRDSRNYKKNKSIVEDKTTDDFKRWIYSQYMIALSGTLDILLSLIVFLIGRSI